MTEIQDIYFAHAPDRRRYEIRDGETVAGFTQYRLPDDQHVDFVHTEVDEAYNGRGLASGLVSFALADVRKSGKRIIPHCPYVASWITRHPEYNDITDVPA
ncbi:GNAT family N-acetyltransferase [Demetria terragena]|uniref:GNAT family N-acetyltransferase n=1 Tax=Demetria terragena TaxID=63959 RepID=UPI0003781815|nr:GNAT family N-acetyltransferase [Demetria terragena]